jgi:hypothetical protein
VLLLPQVSQKARQLLPLVEARVASLAAELESSSGETSDLKHLECLRRLVLWLQLTRDGGLLHGASVARSMMLGHGTVVKLESGLIWHEGLANPSEGPAELLEIIQEYLEAHDVWPEDGGAAGAPGAPTAPLGWTEDGYSVANQVALREIGLAQGLNVLDVDWMHCQLHLAAERAWVLATTPHVPRAQSAWFLGPATTAVLVESQGRVVWHLALRPDRRVAGHFMNTTPRQTALGVVMEPGSWEILQMQVGSFGTSTIMAALTTMAHGCPYFLAAKMQPAGRLGQRQPDSFILLQALALPENFMAPPTLP